MKPFNSIHIKTKRLNIRPISMHDIDEVFAIFGDSKTMQYWDDVPMQNISQAREKIKHNVLTNEKGTALTLVIEFKDTQRMIGQISLFNIHKASARAETGFVLSKKHWQKGLMSEAFQAFIVCCFTTMNLRRLEADIDPANQASAALLKKSGFHKEGCLKERWVVGGLTTDSDVYGLLKSAWQKFIIG